MKNIKISIENNSLTITKSNVKVENYAKVPLDKIKNICSENSFYLKDEKNNLYLLQIKLDEYPENPREWDSICTICSEPGRWDISDEGYSMPGREQIALIHKDETYYKPIYMYDHGGQTISLKKFNCPWDSGLCGFIFVTKEKMKKEGFDVSTDAAWHAKADELMKEEIETYNQFLKNEVYRYVLSKVIKIKHTGEKFDWAVIGYEEEDSCGGFYGDDITKNGIIESLPSDFEFIKLPKDFDPLDIGE